jgi:hypothetical protein
MTKCLFSLRHPIAPLFCGLTGLFLFCPQARGADLSAWVEDLLGEPSPVRKAPANSHSAAFTFAPEHSLVAEWKRTSPFGRQNGVRFQQEVEAKLSSDFGNGLSTELSSAFETQRGPLKGEDSDGFEATGIAAFDVLGFGSSSTSFLAQKEQATEDAADLEGAQSSLFERSHELREALVDYVRYACLQKAFEQARVRVDEAWERTQALRQAASLSKKEELAMRSLQAETVATLERVSAELQNVAPRILAEGGDTGRRVAAANFADESFCTPTDAFAANRTPNEASVRPPLQIAERAEAAHVFAKAQVELARLERARAQTRPKLAPFVGVGWEQEGGQGARRNYVLGVRFETTFGGFDEVPSRLSIAREATRQERTAGVLAVEAEQAYPALKRRRVRAFEAARVRYEAAAALRANEEAQWKAGLVSASDFTKAWLDATDAYEDLFEAWREAALLGR